MISLYRYMGNNFGDNLSTYITEKISGEKSISPPAGKPVYVVVGSILEWAPNDSIVWGAGYMTDNSRMPTKSSKICAVRGKMTRDMLLRQGHECPEMYGDPSLLLPRYYTPKSTRNRWQRGVIPHYVDYASPKLDEYRHDTSTIIINVRDPVEQIIDDINSCNHITSSSLHGLIVADAYGIPSNWIKWSDKVVGGGFKFHDYFSVRRAVDLDALYDACPFRKDK